MIVDDELLAGEERRLAQALEQASAQMHATRGALMMVRDLRRRLAEPEPASDDNGGGHVAESPPTPGTERGA